MVALMRILTVAIVLCVASFPTLLNAQWLNHPTPGIPRTTDGKPNLAAPAPRTADGKPDLTGIWNIINPVSDLQPGDIEPWAQALIDERNENFNKDNPAYWCLPTGPAGVSGVKRIVQTPAMIVMLGESLLYRQIFTDGRELETDPNPSWMGYSVGYWEGDTLVVESAGFNDRTWLLGNPPHTQELRMTERYRRTSLGHMEVRVTYRDPGAYKKPWTTALTAELMADTELLEAVCNEGPHGQEHWVGRVSDAEKSAVKVAPEILAKYVGVYKGEWARRPRTVEIMFSDGELFVSVEGRERRHLVPQSETRFAGSGLAYDFVIERGAVTRVIEGHISGDYPLERQK
jgi:hypothetical protein